MIQTRFHSSLSRFSPTWAARIRRNICAALLACLALSVHAAGHDEPLKSIAVLDFELIDDQHELSPAKAEYSRLPAISDQLRAAFTKNGLYRVVDNQPEMALIERYRTHQSLYACNGCELEIGKALHADRVLVGWVQKVSNLILNINIAVKDVATGEVVLNKSVDLRGNTDETAPRHRLPGEEHGGRAPESLSAMRSTDRIQTHELAPPRGRAGVPGSHVTRTRDPARPARGFASPSLTLRSGSAASGAIPAVRRARGTGCLRAQRRTRGRTCHWDR